MMSRSKFIGQCILLLLLLSSVFAKPALSNLSWHWAYHDPYPVVSPTDDIMFWATLYNEPESTDFIYGPKYKLEYWWQNSSCCNNALTSQYTLKNPGMGGDISVSPNYFDQFYDLVLAPGESFDFVFLNLKPKDGTVDIGTYTIFSRITIKYGVDPATQGDSRYADVTPIITVQNTPPIIPEPISSILFLVGGSLLAGRKYLRKGMINEEKINSSY